MNAVDQATTLPEIGQPFAGGFLTGILIQNGQRYAIITAAAEHEIEGAWGEYGQTVEGAGSFTDSRANTEAMANAGSEVARKVVDLNINGYTDWAIPARDAQELQYRNLKPTTETNWAYNRDGDNPHSEPVGTLYTREHPAQTSVEAFQRGGPEAFRSAWYWSSSQRSADYAFSMTFGGGGQGHYGKYGEFFVRPVRSQIIQ